MKTMYKVFMIAVFAIASGNLFAQTQEQQDAAERLKKKPLNGFFGLTFANAVPQGDFYSNLHKTGLGLSLYGGYYADPIPVAFGLQGDILFFGGDTKYFTWQKPGGWNAGTDTVETQSMIIPITVFARLQPNTGIVFPFIEAFAGVNLFSATATYKPYWGPQDDKDKFSASFAYGLGAGISVKLVDFIQLPNQRTSLNLDIKMRYAFGTNADYYKVKLDNNTTPEFTSFKSETDMIITNVGVSFCF